MPTTQKGSWSEKLLITERDCRRLFDLITEKIKGFSPSPVVTNFYYSLSGGSSTTTSSLDDLFFEDNLGSRSISAIYADISNIDKTYEIHLDFSVGSDYYKRTAYFAISGLDRGSVLVIASEIEERINLLRDRPLIPIRPGGITSGVLALLFASGSLAGATAVFFGAQLDRNRTQIQKFLETNPEKTIENLFTLVAMSNSPQKIITSLPVATIPFIFAVGCVISFVFLLSVPGYKRMAHFMWGDYIRFYEEQKKRREVWIYVIGVGFILSVLSSVLTALFY